MFRKTLITVGTLVVLGTAMAVAAPQNPGTRSSAAVVDSPPTAAQPEQQVHNGHHDFGVEALGQGRLELALWHFSIAARNDPGSPDSIRVAKSLVDATDQYVARLLGEGKHTEAWEVAENAADILVTIRSELEHPESPARPLGDLHTLVLDLDRIFRDIQTHASAMMVDHLQSAEKLAWESRRWYWLNDRDSVREGLRSLREVHDRLGIVDRNTQAEYFRVLNVLKDRVSDKEWDSLCASAGIF